MISILILNVFQRFSIQAVKCNGVRINWADTVLSRDCIILSQFFIIFRIPSNKTFTFFIFLRRFWSGHTTLNKRPCFFKPIRTNKRECKNTSIVVVFSIDCQILRYLIKCLIPLVKALV